MVQVFASQGWIGAFESGPGRGEETIVLDGEVVLPFVQSESSSYASRSYKKQPDVIKALRAGERGS